MSPPVVKALLVSMILCCAAAEGAAPVDTYTFADTHQESRYRALIDEFRCPKCLNTNLSGSDAPIAMDLRRTVYRLVTVEHLEDGEIRTYLQERYGDFVLYDPPFKPATWALWLAPVGFVLISVLVLLRVLRQPPAEPLSVSETERLRVILDDD
ncbi:MAG: cytochrome c-type biogenesis protein CcmH [Gammaproteobacteria bacterium]|nr:cytochrome c-type biogenesis protein CcmH [Gammaproteobacteria bacterium]